MIDFKEELKKYSPILETEQVEDSVNQSDTRDLMDILQSLIGKNKFSDRE